MKKSKYDWVEIQKFYDEGNSYSDITEKFGASSSSIDWAKRNGMFVSRSRSEGIKISINDRFNNKFEDFDWDEVQKFYDDGNSIRTCSEKFGISISTIRKYSKLGYMRIRSRSEATSISRNTEEYKKKISDYWTPERRKVVSEHRKKYLIDNPDKHPAVILAKNNNISYPEKMAYCYFEDNGFNFEHQKSILNYVVDFVIDNKYVIEVDGKYWHDPVYDKKRDIVIENEGYIVTRFTAKDIISQLNVYFNTEYTITLDESKRRTEGLKKEPVVYEHQCLFCGTKFSTNTKHKRKYCGTDCANKANVASRKQRSKCPSKEQLIQDLIELPWTGVGNKYGVSDNSVRKWAVKYELGKDRKKIIEQFDIR